MMEEELEPGWRSINKVFTESFEEVKEAVRKHEGRSRAGLMLGLQEMGTMPQGFIGAYYPLYSNIIVINKTPIRRIMETQPSLLEPYGRHLLLHEYIHSLGFEDEDETRRKSYDISKRAWGEFDTATQLAFDIQPYLPSLIYPSYGFQPDGSAPIEIVKQFDSSNTRQYIT
ncbi:Uncharacterised protein [uncultured archaeon]|nr:Uncharacterised protein [uncultured archaeon]